MTPRSLGVDGCPDGWVGVALDPDRVRAYTAATVADLVGLAEADGPLTWVGVDIPVGLADAGLREADVEVRRRLGPRASSLFLTPVRAALAAPDHAAGQQRNREATGQGFSRQAYGLRTKILEVDELVAHGETRVFEVHPEWSFAQLAGAPMAAGKKSWAGLQQRLRALAAEGIRLDGLEEQTGRASVDDVVDAAAVAWTARRRALGTARSWPDPPQPLGRVACAIWA